MHKYIQIHLLFVKCLGKLQGDLKRVLNIAMESKKLIN